MFTDVRVAERPDLRVGLFGSLAPAKRGPSESPFQGRRNVISYATGCIHAGNTGVRR